MAQRRKKKRSAVGSWQTVTTVISAIMERSGEKSGFNATKDAETLVGKVNSMQDKVIEFACYRSAKQREEISREYEQIHGKNFTDMMRKGTDAEYSKLVISLFLSHEALDAHLMTMALKAKPIDLRTIFELFLTRSNRETQTMKEIYKDKFERELEDDITAKTTGDIQDILMYFATCSRRQAVSTHDKEQTERDLELLNQSNPKSSDKKELLKIFCTRSFEQLLYLFDAYEEVDGKDIHERIDYLFTGDVQLALKMTVLIANSRALYFTHLLHAALSKSPFDSDVLTRVIIRRQETDLPTIKTLYKELFNATLEDAVFEANGKLQVKKVHQAIVSSTAESSETDQQDKSY